MPALRPTGDGMQQLAWLSTRYRCDGELGALSVEDIVKLARDASSITIVSAFFHEEFLSSIARAVPSSRRGNTTINIYVHAFPGRRGTEDVERLKALRKGLRGFGAVNIGLVPCGGLFHSKLFVLERGKTAAVLVGSANATNAAFAENEELMLHLDGRLPTEVRSYLDAIRSKAKNLDAYEAPTITTLVALLRSGDMYFRPNVTKQFRFSLRLPPGLRRALARMRVDIAGITARASQSYDPFANLGVAQADQDALADDEERGEGRARVALRSYAVQTCYGWWAPHRYEAHLDGLIRRASASRKASLDRIAQFVARERERIRTAAQQRFERLAAFAIEQSEPLTESSDDRMHRFDAHLQRVHDRLENTRWRERASKAYVLAAVPEVWSDPVSADEFMGSFFEDLEYIASQGRDYLLWKSLKRVTGIEDSAFADTIRKKLVGYLRKRPWQEENWLLPPTKRR